MARDVRAPGIVVVWRIVRACEGGVPVPNPDSVRISLVGEPPKAYDPPMGYLLLFGTIALVAALGWVLRRWTKDFEDYHEREFEDPPVFDAGNMLGGGGFM